MGRAVIKFGLTDIPTATITQEIKIKVAKISTTIS
jgi:hypothetical protein